MSAKRKPIPSSEPAQPHLVPTLVETARARLQAAELVVQTSLATWEASLLDAPEAAQLEGETAYLKARREQERAQLALGAAERRYAADLLQIEGEERARRWSEVRRLLAQRRNLAVDLDRALAAVELIAANWREVDRAIRAAHPAWNPNLPAGDVFVDQGVALAISKRGWFGAMWNRDQAAGMPTLVEQVQRHERALLHGAPAA